MQQGFNILIVVGLGAVLIILALGLWNMFKDGDPNMSQKLMRARVLVQAIVIALIMAALYFFSPKA